MVWAHHLTSLSLSILVCEMGMIYMSASQASIKHVTKYQAHWRRSGRACMLPCRLLGNSRLCLFLSLSSLFVFLSRFLLISLPSLGTDHELLSLLLRAHLLLLAPVFYQSRRRDRREISCPLLRG